MSLIRLIVIAGFVIGAIGILIALPAEDRSLGFGVFLAGFLLLVIGIIANTFLLTSIDKAQSASSGIKTASVGFGIAAIGGGISAVLDKESVSDIFFYTGSTILLIGMLVAIFGILRSGKL